MDAVAGCMGGVHEDSPTTSRARQGSVLGLDEHSPPPCEVTLPAAKACGVHRGVRRHNGRGVPPAGAQQRSNDHAALVQAGNPMRQGPAGLPKLGALHLAGSMGPPCPMEMEGWWSQLLDVL